MVALRPGSPCDPALLEPMAAVTRHRGPDDEGHFTDQGLAMGMRRLSIIDVSTGHQPIANEDETVWTVCNGEIYNFRDVRARLLEQGHRFKTGSDTEVIVHLYETYGLDMVEHMEGMFAFALWDKTRRRLIIGRDRIGIKPLYFLQHEGRLIFASEIKALLTVPGIERAVDQSALQDYLSLGYSGNEQSIFKGIRKLPPASIMICEDGSFDVKCYWQAPAEADHGPDEAAWAERLFVKPWKPPWFRKWSVTSPWGPSSAAASIPVRSSPSWPSTAVNR